MIRKIVFFFFSSLLILIAAILFQSVDPEQEKPAISIYQFPDSLSKYSYDLDSLKALVGETKGLPAGFEEAALIAFSAYPELKDVRIDMVLTESGAPMESNFDIITLFGSGENRVYKILLNNAPKTNFDPILLRSLPFDAQVGILAHELGHVAYYHKLNTLQIAKWGISYLLDDEFRAIHERSTDMMTIYHGLGSQIYQYAWYVRNDPSCRSMYEKFGAEFIDKYYLTDGEIKFAIANLE
ncbi:MAG: hypothetical protein AAFQ94_28180 [Bacteroidota bacterium]